jgi:NAD(P)-dependent dehydrogenase (short-subunit alcohol dehydrogenase family)
MNTKAYRVVLITGASSGFGRASAEHLSRRGYRVYGTSRDEKEENGSEHTALGNASFRMIAMDVREDATVQKGVDLILSRENRLDIVINNAGYALAGTVEDCPLEEVKNQIETNLIGTWRVCQAVLPHMRNQGSGTIINISSLAGLIALPFQAAYCASKFAVEALTESLRMEVKPFGIKVCLIEPGDFKTRLTENRIKANPLNENSAYYKNFKKAVSVMEHSELHGPQPEKLAALIESIINNPSPRLRYTAGLKSQRMAAIIKRITPGWLTEWGVRNSFELSG